MTDASPARTARWKVPLVLAGALLFALALPVVLVGTSAAPWAPPAEPDRALVVPLPDGTETTLGALLDGDVPPSTKPAQRFEIPQADGTTRVLEIPPPPNDDLFVVGVHACWRGRVDVAVECLSRVPRDNPRWADAQRYLGWEVYTQRLGDPQRGLPHIHASLAADPLEGNAWQDAIRVYLEAMGVDQ